MNKKLPLISLLLASLLGLSACGGGGSSSSDNDNTATGDTTTTTTTTTATLLGSAFKGAIDNALIRVLDANNQELATASSSAGQFSLALNLAASDQAIFIETVNGYYTDEATGEVVNIAGVGLRTVFTASELNTLINNKQFIALTPESTIIAGLVKNSLSKGITAIQAIADAKTIVQRELIDGTNPTLGIQGDNVLMTGDFSAVLPVDSAEALARNRAISFSLEAKSKNLAPQQVFELITANIDDLKDGKLDGKAGTVALKITEKEGQTQRDLSKEDRKTHYALARARLLNNTLKRLSDGNISEAEKASFKTLGLDLDSIDLRIANNQAAQARTGEHLSANNLPAFNHLPILTDEDGDANNGAATYTLTADPSVNVTINSPTGSWTTPMMRYNSLQLPPIIKAKRNDNMTLNVINDLSSDTTIHWHGFKIPADQDGGADFPIAAASSKQYSFPMLQPAASLWFHPHPDLKTGEQVYRGLAGVYLLSDTISEQLETAKQLPAGNFDIPMLIQDRRFKAERNGVRELAYKTMEMDGDGMLGDTILVNGAVLPKLVVETRQYRFRIYNTSNARTYDFALSDGKKFKVIGTDGGLLASPVEVDHIMLGAAERAEIIIDFSQYNVNDKVMLVSQAFNSGMMDTMMESMNSDMSGGIMEGMLANGMYLDIMRFDIATAVTDDVTLYSALPSNAEIYTRSTASQAGNTRNFVMTMMMGNGNDAGMGNGDMSGNDAGMGNGGMSGNDAGMGNGGMTNMRFVINGKTFDMDRIDEVVDLSKLANNTEIWSIQNLSPMAHPFHAHAIQWQILDRDGIAATGIDLGWKDTVLVQPGETVNFIGRFDPVVNKGNYMYHCHILEHEDAGMMGSFKIQ